MASPALIAVDIADARQRWIDLGFCVDADGVCRVGSVDLRLGDHPSPYAVTAWALGAAEDGVRTEGASLLLDGLPTRFVRARQRPPGAHPNTARSVDHVVVSTPDVDRTVLALTAVGMRLRGERQVPGPRPLRQAFFRPGEAIVEVVGPAEVEGDGPSRLWGITVTVADLRACVSLLGEHLGGVRDAVQPGRRIATVLGEHGQGVALALMTPPC